MLQWKQIKIDMKQLLKRGILGSARNHFFILFALLFLSGAFFVSAADELTGKNIIDDPDQDGLTTEEELLYGTDQTNFDTDGDGYSDGVEVRGGYDPLKKAPGDKIVPEKIQSAEDAALSPGIGGDNLTERTAQEIAALIRDVQSSDTDGTEISLEELNAVAQNLASGDVEEVVLPEVDMDAIKVKKASCKNLPKKKCDEKVKEDVVEYLTVIAYIFANNSPKSFDTEEDLRLFSDSISDDVIFALASGDFSSLTAFVESGEKMLSQIYDVEVPEDMLGVHVKAIKLAKYAANLNGEISSNPEEDPMKMIASLSKVQGLLNVAVSFSSEVMGKVNAYGIDEVSIDGF